MLSKLLVIIFSNSFLSRALNFLITSSGIFNFLISSNIFSLKSAGAFFPSKIHLICDRSEISEIFKSLPNCSRKLAGGMSLTDLNSSAPCVSSSNSNTLMMRFKTYFSNTLSSCKSLINTYTLSSVTTGAPIVTFFLILSGTRSMSLRLSTSITPISLPRRLSTK